MKKRITYVSKLIYLYDNIHFFIYFFESTLNSRIDAVRERSLMSLEQIERMIMEIEYYKMKRLGSWNKEHFLL
jgi:hypothetical protein